MKIDYKTLLVPTRIHTEKTSRSLEEEFSSDKSRVIFSSAFRRMQQKAQVFSLETNAAVRSRLTHTLEVSDTSSQIARKIAFELRNEGKLDPDLVAPFIELTETTCLLHDIGNPPFGHFGEAAISQWFNYNSEELATKSILSANEWEDSILSKSLINDFCKFDGNPQGIRIILHLQDLPDSKHGFNLTYSQILSMIKYLPNPDEVDHDRPLYKKAGFFHSEAKKVEFIRKKMNWPGRHPITYIMEAADDISYCLSDIEDGIEKNILTSKNFFDYFLENVGDKAKHFINDILPLEKRSTKADFYLFKITFTRKLIKYSADNFIMKEEEIANGSISELINKGSEEYIVLKALKNLARKYLFRSKEAENNELAGYKIIYGLLDCYKPILVLPNEKFENLLESQKDIEALNKGLDIEWRLFNRLPEKHINAYRSAIELLDGQNIDQYKWFYRAHLIVDYISGMTDNFALETYRLLNGIEI